MTKTSAKRLQRRSWIVALATAFCGRAGAAILYDSDTGNYGFPTAANHYAQQITLAGPDQAYSINNFTLFGIDWSNISAGTQTLTLNFYEDANLSATTGSALATALPVASTRYQLAPPSIAGKYNYTLSLATPLQVPSNTFTLEVTTTDANGAYSTAMGGVFTAGVPSVGSNPGFIWNDANHDGLLAGSEQSNASLGTTFNIDMQVDATGATSATYQWNAVSSGSWESAASWSPQGVPGFGDSAVFNLSSNPVNAPGYTVAANAADKVKNLSVESDRLTIALSSASASLTVFGALGVGQQISSGPATAGTTRGYLTLARSNGNSIVNVYAGAVVVGSNGGIGSLTIGPGVELHTSNDTSVGPGSVLTVQPGGFFSPTTLTLAGSTDAWTGKVDLTSGSLDLPGGSLATVTNQVKQGYNLAGGANWAGTGGIVSSSAATDSTHLTALGVIQNNQSSVPIYSASHRFNGIAPNPGDILIQYTWFGDANLDQKVDGSDYTLIDNGFASDGRLTGWYNGDFNYDGVIDGSDYSLIDNAYNNQSPRGLGATAIVATISAQLSATAVPEPGLLLPIVGLLIFRRKRDMRQ